MRNISLLLDKYRVHIHYMFRQRKRKRAKIPSLGRRELQDLKWSQLMTAPIFGFNCHLTWRFCQLGYKRDHECAPFSTLCLSMKLDIITSNIHELLVQEPREARPCYQHGSLLQDDMRWKCASRYLAMELLVLWCSRPMSNKLELIGRWHLQSAWKVQG